MMSELKENPKVQRHMDICTGLNILYAQKNHDYGDSFHETFVEEGMAMARIRLSDKLNRFKRLTKLNENAGIAGIAVPQVKDESIRDTLLDLANYAIMTVMEMDIQDEEAKDEIKKALRAIKEVKVQTEEQPPLVCPICGSPIITDLANKIHCCGNLSCNWIWKPKKECGEFKVSEPSEENHKEDSYIFCPECGAKTYKLTETRGPRYIKCPECGWTHTIPDECHNEQ